MALSGCGSGGAAPSGSRAEPWPCLTAVVTGATGGIGRFIALGLAQDGYRVVLIGRDPARLEACRGWIAGRVPGAVLLVETADLSLLEQTGRVGRAVAERCGVVDLLVLNAGLVDTRRTVTAEGHERVLAVNHLSPVVLVRTLAPALAAGAIVTVGSSTSDRARIDPDDLEMGRGWSIQGAYARSKLAVMMATFDWAERLPGVANVVHPGLVRTGLVAKPGVVGLAWSVIGRFGRSPERGAATPLHVARLGVTAPSGRYWKACAEARANPRATDPALRRRVREATARLVEGAGGGPIGGAVAGADGGG